MAKPADFRKIVAQMGKMSATERKAMMADWSKWTKGKMVANMGAPVGRNKRVRARSVSDQRNEVGGYSIIKARTHAEAAKKMQSNPHFKMIPGGWIDVMEVMPM